MYTTTQFAKLIGVDHIRKVKAAKENIEEIVKEQLN